MSDDELREAASIVVGRDGDLGLEVLLVERGARSRFLAGYVAFPGGSIERGDAELAARWFADPIEAPRAAAVRELIEETRLALTANGVIDTNDPASLDPIDEAPPSVAQLPLIARWVAPARVPVRFDARYFAVAAPSGIDPAPDGGETAQAWWSSPDQLLREWHEGARILYWPTYFTVVQIESCGSVADLLALRLETREPDQDEEARLPRSLFYQD